MAKSTFQGRDAQGRVIEIMADTVDGELATTDPGSHTHTDYAAAVHSHDAGAHSHAEYATDTDLSTHAGTAHGLSSHALDGVYHSGIEVLPTSGQKNALAGTTGTPGDLNRYVTNSDTRLSDARTPTTHGHDEYATDADLAAHAATNHGGSHPDLTAHDTLGLATQAELDAHAATAHGGSHPDLAAHDTLGLATQAELDGHNHDAAYSAAGHTHAHPDLAAHDTLGLATQAELDAHAATSHGGAGEAFPVGSIFIAAVSTNPATLLGYGTWAAFAAGRVLVGIDAADPDFDLAEETGGAKTHTLTEAEMSSHSHVEQAPSTASGGAMRFGIDTNASGTVAAGLSTQAAGGGAAHNNLQPYVVVYMWRRTA